MKQQVFYLIVLTCFLKQVYSMSFGDFPGITNNPIEESLVAISQMSEVETFDLETAVKGLPKGITAYPKSTTKPTVTIKVDLEGLGDTGGIRNKRADVWTENFSESKSVVMPFTVNSFDYNRVQGGFSPSLSEQFPSSDFEKLDLSFPVKNVEPKISVDGKTRSTIPALEFYRKSK